MTPYLQNIEKLTSQNTHFRQVVYTSQHLQLVIMHLNPGEEIGTEIHETVDQFFRIESGTAKVVIAGQDSSASDGDVIIVPAGTEHNIINTSNSSPLKFYTIYAPPHHKDHTIHHTKKEAEGDSGDHL